MITSLTVVTAAKFGQLIESTGATKVMLYVHGYTNTPSIVFKAAGDMNKIYAEKGDKALGRVGYDEKKIIPGPIVKKECADWNSTMPWGSWLQGHSYHCCELACQYYVDEM